MSPTRKAYVETYGCQMNLSDGELMSGVLASNGFELVETPDEADVVLVNTCAIREHAEQRVLGRVAQLNGLKEKNPGLLLGVTGCMAQRMGEELVRKAPYVDLVMGPDGYRGLPEALRAAAEHGETQAGAGAGPGAGPGVGPEPAELGSPQAHRRERGRGLTVLDLDPAENYEGLELRRRSSVSAWIPIQRGCNHRCTFCIVPYVRGPEKNRSPQAVLEEIRRVTEEGITEVTLLGQTVNSYREGGWDFPRLLRAVARIPGIRRVRFTSPHPNDVTPELVEVMAEEEAVCEQLHLPLQAGNDRTLKRMLRRHTVAEFLEKVEIIRGSIPDMAISTDVIVAFPGETDSEFRDTLSVLERVRFDDAFTYRFSPREGTPATRFPPDELIPENEGRARLEELIELTRGIQREINEGEVGRVDEVLVENKGREDGFMLGRTRRNKVAVFPREDAQLGSYQTVELTRTTGATFVGSLVATQTEVEPK
jgi:tRNA-2-methylthio-N6-dimethylallyladenosine synthase